MTSEKKKIVVIGGGLGAMTAIYNIMKQPNAKDKYEITLYQDGWRVGGKGASGANREKGDRIEEHGIHFWFGFYENGFHMMREVYKGLDRPATSPVATFDDAFQAQPYMDFAQEVDDKWTDWKVNFPKLPGTVGDGKFLNPIDEMIEIGINMLVAELKKIRKELSHNNIVAFLEKFKIPHHPTHESLLSKLESKIEDPLAHAIEKRISAFAGLLKDTENFKEEDRKHHIAFLDNLKKFIWDLIGDLTTKNLEVFRVWCVLDFGFALMKGMIDYKVIFVKNGTFHLSFTQINCYDFEEWLVMNGADKKYIDGFAAVKSMYDGPFAIFQGSVKAPNVEAGTSLNILLRIALTSKEAVMFRMMGGMGDIIFTPIYQLLLKEFPENVTFEFFHKVTDLKLSEDKHRVEKIIIDKQVNLKVGIEKYNPLVDVKGLPCWTAAPDYEQLDPDQAEKIKKEVNAITSDWSQWRGEEIEKTYGQDFDQVIIGASLSSLPHFCTELISYNPSWSAMLNNIGTVQTQAFQLWLTKDPGELNVDPGKVLSCYVEPLDTYADMFQTLAREDWSAYDNPPKYLLYVCGALRDSENIPPPSGSYFPDNQKEIVFQHMLDYVKNDLQFVLPGAFDEAGNFDWDILFDPTNADGEDRLKYQYYRANLDGSERYVYAIVNSSKHRLKTDESGYENVFLTGDWIQNGMNIGFVEGATISGLMTARAVTGDDSIPIYLPW